MDESDQMLDLETDDGTRTFYGNVARVGVTGIRPQGLKRLIALDTVIKFEYYENGGEVYEEWLAQKNPDIAVSHRHFVLSLTASQLPRLEESATAIFDETDVEWLLDMSERTARDYVETLKHFYVG